MLSGLLPVTMVPNLYYLGISLQAWVVSAGHAALFPRLNCTHKEADDRMMFHVLKSSIRTYILDAVMCLLYHITVNWRDHGLQELWLIRNSGVKKYILPLHDISRR